MEIAKRVGASLLSSYNLKFCTKAECNAAMKVGDVLKLSRVFTNEDVVEYSNVSQDMNPLHFDAKTARNAGFEDCLVHGMLVASLFPRIISSHFPGAVYVSQNLQFKHPVYIGEEIIGEVHAISMRDFKKKHLVKFSTRCLKQDGCLVLDGEATTILPKVNLKEEQCMRGDKNFNL